MSDESKLYAMTGQRITPQPIGGSSPYPLWRSQHSSLLSTASNESPWCDWCGRAIKQQDGRWIAVKGEERGYDPVPCDANTDDGTHEPAGCSA